MGIPGAAAPGEVVYAGNLVPGFTNFFGVDELYLRDLTTGTTTMLSVAPDGQTLVVRGYIGFEMLGQNQYWTRLPDSAYSVLDPSLNPHSAVTSNPAAKHAPVVPHKPELAPHPSPPPGIKPSIQ